MSQLLYAIEMVNYGYIEIKEEECPVKFKRGSLYYKKGDRYAMVDKGGHFFNWKHPDETEIVKGRCKNG